MSNAAVACAASALLADLVDDAGDRPLRVNELARTRSSAHYATGRDDVPVLCLALPDAVRLPASMVVPTLPSGPVLVEGAGLSDGTLRWRVARWWQPPRPSGLVPPAVSPAASETFEDLVPRRLVGRGPGLTPSGDDVVAGALVAAYATADPRVSRWRAETRAALATGSTTAVSQALLRHAMDGYATPELADFLTAVCAGDAASATTRLLAVGHSSGAALAAGALHVLRTHPAVGRRAA